MTDVWVMLCVSEVDIAETEHPSLRHTFLVPSHHLSPAWSRTLKEWTTRVPKGVGVGVGRMGRWHIQYQGWVCCFKPACFQGCSDHGFSLSLSLAWNWGVTPLTASAHFTGSHCPWVHIPSWTLQMPIVAWLPFRNHADYFKCSAQGVDNSSHLPFAICLTAVPLMCRSCFLPQCYCLGKYSHLVTRLLKLACKTMSHLQQCHSQGN